MHNRKSRTVTVTQSAEGLGLDIVGLTRVGLFVNSIQEGSVAERSGQIQRGDQVMEVNGMSCGKESGLFLCLYDTRMYTSPDERICVCWVLFEIKFEN